MSNKNYTGSSEKLVINDKNEFAVHHTDYNEHGRRSYDYDISGGSKYNDHETRNSDDRKNQVSGDSSKQKGNLP